LVTATDGTQTRAILGGAVSIDVIVSVVSEMENRYAGTLAVDRLNTRWLKSTDSYTHRRNFTSSQPNEMRHEMSNYFIICGIVFDVITSLASVC
jgi:hypothetical protein